MIETILCTYLISINALGLLLMHLDKQKARKGRWRISEATLITVALLGGSLGILAGMLLFRHKTRHAKFFLGVPAILSLQILLFMFLRG